VQVCKFVFEWLDMDGWDRLGLKVCELPLPQVLVVCVTPFKWERMLWELCGNVKNGIAKVLQEAHFLCRVLKTSGNTRWTNSDVTLEVFISVTVTNHRSLFLCVQLEMSVVKICACF